MSAEFDREQFLSSGCVCGCEARELLLQKIEQFQDTEPDVARWLSYVRDDKIERDKDARDYHQMVVELGKEGVRKLTAQALRAMADKVEQNGSHFIMHSRLPKLPIFSDDDYYAEISLTMVGHPLGS
jgi:hypothetical protein